MTLAALNPKEILLSFMATCDRVASSRSSGVDTGAVILRLASAWPEWCTDVDRKDLAALCRKIHVAGKVMDEYTSDWKKKPGASEIDMALQLLLSCMLLLHAATGLEDGAVGTKDSSASRSLALKSLNAGLVTLDGVLTRGVRGDRVLTLQALADHALENISSRSRP